MRFQRYFQWKFYSKVERESGIWNQVCQKYSTFHIFIYIAGTEGLNTWRNKLWKKQTNRKIIYRKTTLRSTHQHVKGVTWDVLKNKKQNDLKIIYLKQQEKYFISVYVKRILTLDRLVCRQGRNATTRSLGYENDNPTKSFNFENVNPTSIHSFENHNPTKIQSFENHNSTKIQCFENDSITSLRKSITLKTTTSQKHTKISDDKT